MNGNTFRVLIATDGRAPAAAGVSLVARLGDPRRLAVTVLSVDAAPDGPGTSRRQALQAVETVAAALQEEGFAVECRTARGHPGHEITEEIVWGSHDLTVIGAGRHSWLGSVLLGSTSSFVLHNAATSVLIVHVPPHVRDRHRVLLATDGSEGATHAGEVLQSITCPGRSDVTVLSVIALPLYAGAFPYALSGDLLVEVRRKEAEAAARTEAERLGAAGFTATVQTLTGPPSTSILEAAQDGAYDLVVLGSRGLGPVRRTLLGSVSDAVARHAAATLVGRPRA